ncbi:MAG: hypothetical protein VX670_00030 [Candidatus Latescibacterota bacterium]|nr:hypothetical protein [Candidatus Latescibacterota bacterium]MEE2726697.1 hypothetical protein [Candidatus Latescibacterota bacterium]
MRRRVVYSLALWCLAWMDILPARADQINGYVLNPSSEGRVGDVEIVFYVQQDEQVSEIMRKKTDEEGRFSFSGPFLTTGTPFALAALYKDVAYFSSMLEVGAQKQVILEVYDPTDQPDALRIVSHNLFINVTENQIETVHLAQFYNGEERAYVGTGQGPERQVSQFSLPLGALDVQSHSGRMIQVNDTTFFDNQPLLPGHSQLSFSFVLDPNRLTDGYWHESVYPTERINLFIQPITAQIDGGDWVDEGVVDLHGQQYRRLNVTDVQAGQRLLVPLPIDPPTRWILKWAALGGGALAGVGVLLLWGRGPKQTPDREEGLAPLRQQTLAEIARLDAEYAERKDDATYCQARRQLLDRAVDLTRRLEG